MGELREVARQAEVRGLAREAGKRHQPQRARGAAPARERRPGARIPAYGSLRRRHGRIETEIAETEQRLAAINEELSTASAAGDIPLIERLGREYEEKQARLKALWAEWEKVGEQLEKSQDGK